MELDVLKNVLDNIHGATFASLDATTEPKPGLLCETKAARVIIFRTTGGSGYENMVKRRLEEAGKDPDAFNVGSLPWGERIGDLPLIENKGKYYLQTVMLSEGQKHYYLAASHREVNPENFGIRNKKPYGQGLPEEDAVYMKTWNIDNLDRLTILGQELLGSSTVSKKDRAILRMKFPAINKEG